MLKVGLVGVGGISGAHISAWNSMTDVQLVALCDIRPEMLEKYPEKHHYTDLDEMLEKETLDILDICLPTWLHVDVAVKAMEKGIHVLCEKPISLHAQDVDRAYSTAEKMGVQFMVAQVLRFWPEYVLLKEIFDSKKYGKLLSGYMSRLGVRPNWSWDGWMMDESRSGLVPYDRRSEAPLPAPQSGLHQCCIRISRFLHHRRNILVRRPPALCGRLPVPV